MSRITTRIFLGISLILAMGVAYFSLTSIKTPTDAAWATLAAALAVVTSMISAWSAQRVVELEEDKQRPYPYPCFDTTSRYGLMLLRVINTGGGAAHNISLIWDKPLKNAKGEDIRFSPDRDTAEIPVLLPGQSIAKTVDGHIGFFGMNTRHEYSGSILFTDASGKKYKKRFVLDAEMYKDTPLYSEEELKTHYELQKIPDELGKMRKELANLSNLLDKYSKSDDE